MTKLGVLAFLGLTATVFAQEEGKVGINTEKPSATLTVKSKTGTTGSTKNLQLENARTKKLVTVLDNGMVGIGTDTPIAPLHILAPAPAYGNDLILEDYADRSGDPSAIIFNKSRGTKEAPAVLQPGDNVGQIIFSTKNGAATTDLANNRMAEIGAKFKEGSDKGELYFSTSGAARVLIDKDGKVGVGTATPAEKLHVVGDARVSGLSGTGTRNVMADADGKLVIGAAVAEGTFTRNFRTDTNAEATVTDNDYFVYLTQATRVTLPTPNTNNVGRMICMFSPSKDVTIVPQPQGQQQSLTAGYSSCYISTGTRWLNTTGL